MPLVMCKKKGLVEVGYCGHTCTEFEEPDPDNEWDNPPGVCNNFRYIVKNKEEQKRDGIQMVYPHQQKAKHERLSRELHQQEDRDTDHNARKNFPIALPLEMPELKRRKIA